MILFESQNFRGNETGQTKFFIFEKFYIIDPTFATAEGFVAFFVPT